MKKDEVNSKIEAFKPVKEALINLIKEYVQDKSIDIEDRWTVFIKAGENKLVNHDRFYHEPKGINWNKHTLYDDFGIDKYATINVERMLESAIEDKIIEDETAFKEYFMNKFIYSFENDW